MCGHGAGWAPSTQWKHRVTPRLANEFLSTRTRHCLYSIRCTECSCLILVCIPFPNQTPHLQLLTNMQVCGVVRVSLSRAARPVARRHAMGAAGLLGCRTANTNGRRAWDVKRVPTVAAAGVSSAAGTTDPVSTRRVPLRDGFAGRTRVKDIKVRLQAGFDTTIGVAEATVLYAMRTPRSTSFSRRCRRGIWVYCGGRGHRVAKTRACPTSERRTRCAGGCAPFATRRPSHSWTSTMAPPSPASRPCYR
jgi:hypothetical protein